jgi:hypothetical protein
MHEPDERRIIRAAEFENLLADVDRMGSPRGLRNLFPTNRARMTLRTIRSDPMTKKPVQDEPRASGPLARPRGEQEGVQSPQRDERDALQEVDPNAAGTHAGGDGGPLQPPPDYGGQTEPQTIQPAQQADPGPPPARPTYSGEGAVPPQVDVLNMAMEAGDLEAAQLVNVMGAPPALAQYKANVIEWIVRMETYNAQPGTVPYQAAGHRGALARDIVQQNARTMEGRSSRPQGSVGSGDPDDGSGGKGQQ